MSQPALLNFCRACRTRLAHPSLPIKPSSRAFSTSKSFLATDTTPSSHPQQAQGPSSPEAPAVSNSKIPSPPSRTPAGQPSSGTEVTAQMSELARQATSAAANSPSLSVPADEPYHLHVYAHKHNTHITFTEPSRAAILSYSCGNLGLKKSQRSGFDAAYQLSTYAFRKMAEKGWKIGGKSAGGKGEAGLGEKVITLRSPEMRDRGLEVILRGYGPGREAFQKAILGADGKIIKGLVKQVADSTRLKFGGVRSRATKRL